MAGVGKSRYFNPYYKRKLYFPTTDRILLHLLEFVDLEPGVALPDELTQFGIADGIRLGRSTVSKAIRRLVTEGLIRTARAHVPSGKLRRTVYVLTREGVDIANRLRKEIEQEIIVFRDGPGVERKLRVADLPKLVTDYATLLDVATHVSEGVFDGSNFRGRREKLVDMTERVPHLRYFFGREAELAAMDAWLSEPSAKVLIIQGIPGIGKTTLLARKIEDWKREHHVMFYRIMAWTTLRNIVQTLAEFLSRIGRKQMIRYLDGKQSLDLEESISILTEDLRGLPAILVFDDFQNAEEGIRKLFRGLRVGLEDAKADTKLVVAGRTAPSFYDRRDVKVRGAVEEITLSGLDRSSTQKLLLARSMPLRPEEVQDLYIKTHGHPLFLELVDPASASRAVEIGKYLQEELFSRVSDDELRVLKVASVLRGAVHSDALFIDASIDFGTIRSLGEQSLLSEVAPNVFDVHDVIRAHLVERLTPRERKRMNRWAAQFHLSQSKPNALEGLYHLIEAGDSTSAARLAVKEAAAIRKSGASDELFRLLNRLLPAVTERAHGAELRLQKAHALNVLGELEEARAVYSEIVALPQDEALTPKVAEAHRYLGDILRREWELDSAEEHLEAALRLYRNIHHTGGQAETLLSMGLLAENRSNLSLAERLYEKSIEFSQALRLRDREAEAHFNFSHVLAARGDHLGSLERKKRALALAEGIADWHLQARFQVSLGTDLYELKRFQEAIQAYERGIELSRRIGDFRMLAYGLFNAARVHLRGEELSRGEACLKESEALFRKLREPVMTGLVLCSYGDLWEKRGKWQLAKRYLLSGLNLLREGAHDLDFARNAEVAAFYFAKHGDRESALALLDEALSTSLRLKLPNLAERIQRVISEYDQRLAVSSQGKNPRDAAPS